jgi:hypothetical protein
VALFAFFPSMAAAIDAENALLVHQVLQNSDWLGLFQTGVGRIDKK